MEDDSVCKLIQYNYVLLLHPILSLDDLDVMVDGTLGLDVLALSGPLVPMAALMVADPLFLRQCCSEADSNRAHSTGHVQMTALGTVLPPRRAPPTSLDPLYLARYWPLTTQL